VIYCRHKFGSVKQWKCPDLLGDLSDKTALEESTVRLQSLASAFLLSVLFSSTVFAASIAPKASTKSVKKDPYELQISIINKAKLPPKRLAEALYAKCNFSWTMWDSNLMQNAAALNPNDPVYSYQLYTDGILSGIFPPDAFVASRKTWYQRQRKGLDALLTKHPDYLPALYLRVFKLSSLDEKIKELERIAQLDKDNAKPYYIMATQSYNAFKVGRTFTEETKHQAYPLSDAEWNVIAQYLQQGNEQPELRATLARTPSAQDIKVAINGKQWPQVAVECQTSYNLNKQGFALDDSFPTNTELLQIVRQAYWKAEEYSKQGRSADALEVIKITEEFTKKFASSEPRRLLIFLIAHSMMSNCQTGEKEILQALNDKEGLQELEQRRAVWKNSIKACKEVMDKSTVVVKKVMVSPGEPLTYSDSSVEQAGVTRILEDLGITK
jgi:hypothetical protein